ncbi:DUF4230 domain-containing protein [Dysgonomonas sp. 520]|uniref:DUF4230 domain-containing protein n=1 Tax=Dysgonomonas sp. 520 TaxID=2302931 RepID=UPI0013D81171|nr:DUF4230 domain-containing protein [Dysgonomonas sp. 520]NDW09520.1 DUF4230 domain-containing protein [Dysgonomonas sp. 520]
MKTSYKILILLVVLGLVVLYITQCNAKEDKETEKVTNNMILVETKALGKLELVTYSIQNMMQYEKARKWLPNSKTALMVVGQVIGCIDLTKIQPEDITTNGDSVNILLPAPEICVVKIDHSKSKVYDIKYGFWQDAKLVDDAYAYAERELKREALKMNIYNDCRENIKKVLNPIFKAMGTENVTYTFKEVPYDPLQHPVEHELKQSF